MLAKTTAKTQTPKANDVRSIKLASPKKYAKKKKRLRATNKRMSAHEGLTAARFSLLELGINKCFNEMWDAKTSGIDKMAT